LPYIDYAVLSIVIVIIGFSPRPRVQMGALHEASPARPLPLEVLQVAIIVLGDIDIDFLPILRDLDVTDKTTNEKEGYVRGAGSVRGYSLARPSQVEGNHH
jgi:hypothetical protein